MVPAVTGRGGPIVAAGAVLWRPSTTGAADVEICLIHRERYDDWSLPKGKVESGEHVLTAAAREAWEETGHRIMLGRPLLAQRYAVEGRDKVVYFWAARADDGAAAWTATDEVDDVAFLPGPEALRRLSHEGERHTVAALLDSPQPTVPLVVLRHTDAVSRSNWVGADHDRPLSERGRDDASALVPALAAFGIDRVVSSDAVRCAESVRGYADHRGVSLERDHALSEDGFAQTPEQASRIGHKLIDDAVPAVVCSHRPVLPVLLAEATAAAECAVPDEPLRPGGFHVLHSTAGRVVSIETHTASD